MPEEISNKISGEAGKILTDGKLLEITELVALQVGNGYDFTRRFFQEMSLIVAGQLLKRVDNGNGLRGYSHAAFYATHGLGKDYSWNLAANSKIFPFDMLRTGRVDSVTTATLYGTINSGWIVPPVTITNDIIFVGEYSTFMRGNEQVSLAADMRAILENGSYSRRLAMLMELKSELLNPHKRALIENELQRLKTLGLSIDLEKSELSAKSTTSWIISSARFGSETTFGRPLLSMGDIDRFRWRSYVPSLDEKIRVVSEVGSFASTTTNKISIKNLGEAWNYWAVSLKNSLQNNIVTIPRDEENAGKRKELWDRTMKDLRGAYGGDLKDEHYDQIVNLRAHAEFDRIIYQHAALNQFQRDSGYDFSIPDKFVVDYKEDGEFARRLWIEEYVPSLMSVVNDILKSGLKHGRAIKPRNLVEEKIVEILRNGEKDRSKIFAILKEEGISFSDPYLDKILAKLVDEMRILRSDWGVYRLPG